MERAVLHSDLNGFYASVECFSNPKIRNLPVIVGGDPELRHGIVLAKNEIAKKFGIITGEALWQAKQKCPDLVVVKPSYEKYLKFSRLARDIYGRYTDQIESFGIDECWLDVTGSTSLFGGSVKIANEIRETIYTELGITASIGVSFNKIFAKLGSDIRKPNFTTVVSKNNFKDIVWRLPASELLYVGHATKKKLERFGIRTIGNLANSNADVLYGLLGKWGIVLQRFANGEDNSPVKPVGDEAFMKSVGNSATLTRDVSTLDDIRSVFYMLAESVAARLREHGLKASTVQIYVRDNELQSCERQAQLQYPSFLSGEIAEKAIEIFIKKYVIRKPIRSLGVRGMNLVSKDKPFQLDLFADFDKRERLEDLEYSIDDIRRRFGYNSIQKGIIFVDKKLTGINAKDDHVIHPVNFFDGVIQ